MLTKIKHKKAQRIPLCDRLSSLKCLEPLIVENETVTRFFNCDSSIKR